MIPSVTKPASSRALLPGGPPGGKTPNLAARAPAARASRLQKLGASNPGGLRAAHRWLERQLTFALAAQGGWIQRADPVGLCYKKWVRRDYSVTLQGFSSLLTMETFDLYYARNELHFLHWGPGVSRESLFDGLHAGLMYRRKLAPDESYWWSS